MFRQYYPEGGWGCVILFVGVIMIILTTGFQISFSVLVKPAIWKFKPSLLSYISLSGLSITISKMLTPIFVAFCKVGYISRAFKFYKKRGFYNGKDKTFVEKVYKTYSSCWWISDIFRIIDESGFLRNCFFMQK